jgi:hypothetical protein
MSTSPNITDPTKTVPFDVVATIIAVGSPKDQYDFVMAILAQRDRLRAYCNAADRRIAVLAGQEYGTQAIYDAYQAARDALEPGDLGGGS